MKPSIAITLISLGTTLIMVPPAAGYLRQAQVARLLDTINRTPETAGSANVMLPQAISSDYSLGCWLVGLVMILTAIRYSLPGRGPATVRNQPEVALESTRA